MKNQEKNQATATEVLIQVEKEITRIMYTLQKLKNQVGHDDLTGLLCRNDFFAELQKMISLSQGGDIAILLIDIDNFKQVNDLEGHIAGDHILQRVAKILKRCTKMGAHTGRYGGEEFIIAHSGSEASARALAEALRRQIKREVNVTVSVGVATADKAKSEVRRMVGMADQALYQAKRSGKNKVCLAA